MDIALIIGNLCLVIVMLICVSLAIQTAREIMSDLYDPNDRKEEDEK